MQVRVAASSGRRERVKENPVEPTRNNAFPHLLLLLLLFHDFLAMEGEDLANVAALLAARDNIAMIAAEVVSKED